MNGLTHISKHILASKLPTLLERIEKINEKMKAAGAPSIEITHDGMSIKGNDIHGIAGTRLPMVRVSLKRAVDAPSGEIRLLGKTTVDATRFMTHKSFVELNKEQRQFFDNPPHPCHCDHCQTDRPRVNIFVFETPTGLSRVGSSCADDFAGLKIEKWSQGFQESIKAMDEFSEITLSEAMTQSAIKVDDFIKEAVVIIGSLGYFSVKDYGSHNSGWAVYDSILAKSEQDGFVKIDCTPDQIEKAHKVMQYIEGSVNRENDRNSDYFVNLRNLLDFGHLSRKQSTLLASAVRSLDIYEEKLARATTFSGLGNAFVGDLKARTLFKGLTIDAFYYKDGEFGTSTKIHFLDDNKNLIVWKRAGYCEPEIGEKVDLLGTVTGHNRWYSRQYQKEVLETRLTRCVEMTPEEVIKHEQKEEKKAARAAKKAERAERDSTPSL